MWGVCVTESHLEKYGVGPVLAETFSCCASKLIDDISLGKLDSGCPGNKGN